MVIRCIVPGCRSTSSTGFLLKRFPRDTARRDTWYTNIPKHNWEPTDNTYICEIHFEDHDWEQNRVDRLKSSAVPTIFSQQYNYVRRRHRILQKFMGSKIKPESSLTNVRFEKGQEYYQESQNPLLQQHLQTIRKTEKKKSSMDNRGGVSLTDNKTYSMSLHQNNKQESSETILTKRESRRQTYRENTDEEKDLLIAQLQEQVAKQRECISHYESIVQLMNHRLMKFKKVLKTHHLLGELE